MGVDDSLLQNQGTSSDGNSNDETSEDRLVALKNAQREGQNNSNTDSVLASSQTDSNKNLKSTDKAGVLAAIKQKAKLGGAISQAKQAFGQRISLIALALANLLRQSWINLVASFGLTLFWINAHVFGNMVFGNKIFCDLGQEWTMRGGGSKLMAASAQTASGGEDKNKQSIGKSIGIFEKMGLGCLDLTCCLSIIIILTIFSILLEVVSNPLGVSWKIIQGVFGWIWDGIAGIFKSSS